MVINHPSIYPIVIDRYSLSCQSSPSIYLYHPIGRALFFAAKFVFKKHNLIEKFKLDATRLHQFLDKVDQGYHGHNPYHNNIHAADVVMNCHWMIIKGGLIKYIFVILSYPYCIYIYCCMICSSPIPNLSNPPLLSS